LAEPMPGNGKYTFHCSLRECAGNFGCVFLWHRWYLKLPVCAGQASPGVSRLVMGPRIMTG
jgi:hypothetical protein